MVKQNCLFLLSASLLLSIFSDSHSFRMPVEPSGYKSSLLTPDSFRVRQKRDSPIHPQPGPSTKYIHGFGQRYAPYEWPKWYVWHIEEFNTPNKIVASPNGGASNSMGHGWRK